MNSIALRGPLCIVCWRRGQYGFQAPARYEDLCNPCRIKFLCSQPSLSITEVEDELQELDARISALKKEVILEESRLSPLRERSDELRSQVLRRQGAGLRETVTRAFSWKRLEEFQAEAAEADRLVSEQMAVRLLPLRDQLNELLKRQRFCKTILREGVLEHRDQLPPNDFPRVPDPPELPPAAPVPSGQESAVRRKQEQTLARAERADAAIAAKKNLLIAELAREREYYRFQRTSYHRGNDIERFFRREWLPRVESTFGFMCPVCQDTSKLTLDHFWLPKHHGGNFVMVSATETNLLVSNAIVLCRSCNSSKADQAVQDFFTLRCFEVLCTATKRLSREMTSDSKLRDVATRYHRSSIEREMEPPRPRSDIFAERE